MGEHVYHLFAKFPTPERATSAAEALGELYAAYVAETVADATLNGPDPTPAQTAFAERWAISWPGGLYVAAETDWSGPEPIEKTLAEKFHVFADGTTFGTTIHEAYFATHEGVVEFCAKHGAVDLAQTMEDFHLAITFGDFWFEDVTMTFFDDLAFCMGAFERFDDAKARGSIVIELRHATDRRYLAFNAFECLAEVLGASDCASNAVVELVRGATRFTGRSAPSLTLVGP